MSVMATPRSQLVDSETPLFYHLTTRCVRGSWLCGQDPRTGKNYDHRKSWVKQGLFTLARSFAIELYGYAIMSNHFHLIVRFDPGAARRWTNEEVVDRWLNCCTAINRANAMEAGFIRELKREQFLSQPEQIQRLRNTLGSLSMFMKHLKQPIARRANREDNCKGHFFESRFYSGALLDEPAALHALAYVDLNPVRAKIVRRAADAVHTSLRHRLRAAAGSVERLAEYLTPLVSGLEDAEDKEPHRLPLTLAAYLEYLEQFSEDSETPVDEVAVWYQRVAIFRHRQRAFGSLANLSQWAKQRGWSRIGRPCS
ncbi:MAG: transposase [Pseudomonadota bacterium]